ncbi:hypothetical protein [Chitinophaga qingshengii]|uniref:Outer membrane protein beta-barrel domain-containing protein n=1 Tax=Chitinophaga qingshengii TaxID=1569794 RepID=A0ABR7TRS7_9BACT|nr:hypothetical protein [Chitinophaga qingshengii]MBC9933188.1 hypothetical protein [Chitinophaga qingshengii]
MMSALALGTQAQDAPRFRLAVNGGYAYRLGKIASGISGETRDYMKRLKSGLNISADAQYFFSEEWGAGLKYARFQSSGSGVMPVQTPNGVQRGNVSDNIAISFYAASMGGRVFLTSDDSQAFHASLSLGYLRYHDKGMAANRPVELTGGTMGSGVDLGYDIRLVRKLYAGAQLSYIGGVLSSYNQSVDGATTRVDLKDNKENLGYLSITAGLRLNL